MSWQPAFDVRCDLGESPFWHPQERRLYWVDIPGRKLHRGDPQTGDADSWRLPQEPGCIAPAASGGLVIALRDGVYRARSWEGLLQLVVRFNHDVRTTRFNDGKADPRGRFWAGTLYEPKDSRRAELYSIDCRPHNGSGGKPLVMLKAQNAVTANGLAWSPQQDTIYWSDTQDHAIYAWDWEPDSNVMRRHRTFRQFDHKPAGWQAGQDGYLGRPDGAAVDMQGNYWVAMYEGARVLKLSPAGEILETLEVPAQCPTMPCFGGDDLRTLFVTTASKGRPQSELHALPHSGQVLALRVDVPGLPVNNFID